MLSTLFFEETARAEQAALVTRERSTNWAELGRMASSALMALAQVEKRRVGLLFQPVAESYAALAAMDRLAADVFLFDARLPLEQTLGVAGKLKLGALVHVQGEGASSSFEVTELPEEERGSGASTLTILTSGSTGEPKAARHSWATLSGPIRKRNNQSAPVWFLTFRPNLYAGLQVMLQCFADQGTLVVPDSEMNPQAIAEFMGKTGVQFVSATPSYWRRLLMFAEPSLLRAIPLVQVTLGGEVADQSLLDKLARHFPTARLVHIYATTELGRCFSVADKRAGFPAQYLSGALPDGVELIVRDGELLVRSSNSMVMYDPLSMLPARDTEWFATGDLVEVSDDRVYFVGRKTEMINVAGSKVYPVEVEHVIRTVPGVFDVRVFGKTSSIAGQLVACEIVPDPGQDSEALKERVNTACRSRLTSYQQPRLIKVVAEIGVSHAGKVLRGTSA